MADHRSFFLWLPGEGGTPYNKYTERLRPKTHTFFHSSDGVANSLVEVYEVVENLSFLSVKRPKIGTDRCDFMAEPVKDSTFIAVQRNVKF